MDRINKMTFMIAMSLIFPIIISGCGGGGGGGSKKSTGGTNQSGIIEILPAEYDFGTVTPNNSPSPLYVVVKNKGVSNLNVASILLQDSTNFTLDLNGGSDPCGSVLPTLAPGQNCTMEVRFHPDSTASFNTQLTINSSSSSLSRFDLPLSGKREEITSLNVRISQAEIACPSGVVTAYVSVTDQGGYPVTVLTKDDFLITEAGGYDGPPNSSPFVRDNASVSVAVVMDYSPSITLDPFKVSDMEDGAVSFINQMVAGDEAEIVKFSAIVDTVQPFTSDSDLLLLAINTFLDLGPGTALYNAGMSAVDDTALRSKDRKAVILMSDAEDNSSSVGVSDLIDHALSNNVPVFTIGLGATVNEADLIMLADYTGGYYYTASNSDNLRTVYQQLANVLFSYQYILTYNSGLPDETTTDLTVAATLPLTSITDAYTRSLTTCQVQ